MLFYILIAAASYTFCGNIIVPLVILYKQQKPMTPAEGSSFVAGIIGVVVLIGLANIFANDPNHMITFFLIIAVGMFSTIITIATKNR